MSLFRRNKQPDGVPPDFTAGDPRAARLIEALGADDLDAVRAVLTEQLSVPEREALIGTAPEIDGHLELFDAWVEREPDEQTAWLARGAYRVRWAWDARSGARAEFVEEEQFDEFFRRLNLAEDDLERAADMDPDDAVPWTQLLITARGLQIPKEEAWMRYEELQSRQPWLLIAHLQFLQYLCKKWFGSDEESLEFARKTAREAPDAAAVRALIPMAHIEVWLDSDRRDDQTPEDYERRGDVLEEIQEAARTSVFADGFVDDLTTNSATNVFAFALWLFGDEAAAKSLVQRLGRRRSEFPWYYVEDPDALYGQLLAG